MDEARFGQKGTLRNVWAQRGSRLTAVRQTRYEWAHLFAAVEPAPGASSALIAPELNTGIMNVFLRQLATEELGPRDHAILVMDQARWHKSKALEVPDRITILLLPPYSPELNPIERVWAYMRSHHLANRAFADCDAIVDPGADSWRSLTPELLQSICRCEYLERGE